jgi:hypothetical protein
MESIKFPLQLNLIELTSRENWRTLSSKLILALFQMRKTHRLTHIMKDSQIKKTIDGGGFVCAEKSR